MARPAIRRSEASLVEIRQRRAKLSALGRHPDWQELVATVDDAQESKFKSLRHRIYSGGRNAPEVPQREIDYHRGWMDGARWVLSLPEASEHKLEQELRLINEGE